MTLSDSESQELMEFAARIAREAGEITLRYFRKKFDADRKPDGTFVTVADREAEAYLRSEIESHFPDDGILGEEHGERTGTSGRRWILDPIDGTFAFVHGVPLYGVLVGLEVGGEATVGAVNIPALGELVSAARGRGCFLNGERTRVSQTASLEEALLLSSDFALCERYGVGEATERLQRRVGTWRTWGDCYGYVMVATGRAEIMLDGAMNIWDCAAIMPVIEEAGGTFTNWRGERTIYGSNAIATNGALSGEVLRVIQE